MLPPRAEAFDRQDGLRLLEALKSALRGEEFRVDWGAVSGGVWIKLRLD